MATKSKIGFGALENIDNALADGKINAYDILMVKDANGKPYTGWIDKDGNKIICDDSAEFAKLEGQIATKADATEVNAELAKKANTADVDAKLKAALAEHHTEKYEVTDVPEGTLVDYNDREIRVMCPKDTVWAKQTVGSTGDPNCHYMTLKTYVYNDNVVGYKEHVGNQVDEEILTDLKTDEYGRRYQPTWLALASYNESTDTWTYYGKNSTGDKYIGFDYRIDWYDANNKVIASDCVRINLSNEDCHSVIKPYYGVSEMTEAVETANAYTDKKIAEVNAAYEIVEF